MQEVSKVQAERPEQAVVTGRRWMSGEFDALLLKHRLIVNLVRLAIWAMYDASGRIVATFRVNDENTPSIKNDEPFDLPADSDAVGIVDPVHLNAATLRAWGEGFDDYELIPQFKQLGRRVNTLESAERAEVEFKRFADVVVPTITMVGILERLSWTRGIAITTANNCDRGVNEMSAALKRRFNFEAVHLIDKLTVEIDVVQWETDKLLKRADVPVALKPAVLELLVTTFHELRCGKTADGHALEPLTTAMSTAEAVSVGYAAGLHAYY